MAVPRAAALARRLVRSLDARPPGNRRPFGSSPPQLKKRRIAAATAAASGPPPPAGGPTPEDPLDLSSVAAAFAAADAHFRPQLQAVLGGGRFAPDALGALPVALGPGGPAFPLRELAQVVPRAGRAVSLLATDRAHVKPILSAVQASPLFNQQPQRAPDNDLELLLRVEPERPDDLARRVRRDAQAWRDRTRQARARVDRLLHDWLRSGAVLPDVARRAERELQKLQDKKLKEIDAEEAQTLKQLGRR